MLYKMSGQLYDIIGFPVPSKTMWSGCFRPSKYASRLALVFHFVLINFRYMRRMSECTICGKRVMALTAHMKVHEKRPERLEKQLSESIAQGQSPATKSKRAAAQK